ncbi:hypothetical protein [Campylobacter sp. 19-13652]|uniref:hypothetical protein n=1 Tax=Campylobacter sp. 19-13652 TaxID=2840180 RepID=UPI001C77E717|nr:hypothetical protein [Campylobacter sp. 19-13652]BCX79517.1 hypothetical protein LBC_09790 [Campylobacter sp. 19-13652]
MKTITLTISSKDYTVRLEDDFYIAFERDWRDILGGKRFLEPKDLLNAFVKKSFDAYSNEMALKELCKSISEVTGNTQNDSRYESEIERGDDTASKDASNDDYSNINYGFASDMYDDKFNNKPLQEVQHEAQNKNKSDDHFLEFQDKKNAQIVADERFENESFELSLKDDFKDLDDDLQSNQTISPSTEQDSKKDISFTQNSPGYEPLSQIDLVSDMYIKELKEPVSLVSLGHKGVTVTLPLSNNPPLTSECAANTPLSELSKADKMSMTHIDLLSDKKDKFFGDFFDNLSIKKSD